jgi:hypothetical protein
MGVLAYLPFIAVAPIALAVVIPGVRRGFAFLDALDDGSIAADAIALGGAALPDLSQPSLAAIIDGEGFEQDPCLND